MKATAILLELINGYKTYSAAILTIVTGVGAILSKNYSRGATDILQALTLVFGGAQRGWSASRRGQGPHRGPRRGEAARLNVTWRRQSNNRGGREPAG